MAFGTVWHRDFFGVLFSHPEADVLSWPHFIQQWNLPSLSGFIFGMPIEELVWALGFGFTWPLFMAHVFDVRFALQHREHPNPIQFYPDGMDEYAKRYLIMS